MPNPVLGAGDSVLDKRNKDPALTELTVLLGRDNQQAKRKQEHF